MIDAYGNDFLEYRQELNCFGPEYDGLPYDHLELYSPDIDKLDK